MSDVKRIGSVNLGRGSRGAWYDETPQRPIRSFVPAGEVAEVKPGGWVIRERGDREGLVVHAYRCPVHGVFDMRVPRSDVPDSVVCEAPFCIEEAYWAGSLCGQGKSAGECES